MKKLFLSCLFKIFAFSAIGQVLVVDTLNIPIPFVQFSSNKYNFGYSDLNGNVSSLKLDVLENDDTLIINHIAFQIVKLSKATFESCDTIVLIPKVYSLSTVNISSEVPKFQVVKGCYRSQVYINGLLSYFSEGKVEYLLKSKNGKFKGLRINDFISYQNKDIDSIYSKYKTEVGVDNAYIPIPIASKLPNQFKEKNNLNIIKADKNLVHLISEENILVGKLSYNKDISEYSIEDPFNKRDKKLLNTKVTDKSLNYKMIFSYNYNSEKILFSDFNNLLYQMSTYNQSLQHRKENFPKEILIKHELFVEDVSFTDEYNKDYYKDGTGMPVGKSRDIDSWDDCNCKVYSTLDSNFLMRNNMELQTKTNKY